MFRELIKIQELNELKISQNIKIIKNMMEEWGGELTKAKIDMSELRYTNETGFLNPKAQAYILNKNIEVILEKLKKAESMLETQTKSLSRVLLEKERFVIFQADIEEENKIKLESIYENEMDEIIGVGSVYIRNGRKR